MNILYLHSHDTGREIQPYGLDVSTPALQSLANEGALFLNAHCAAPTCSPSRAALLTGHSAHQAGMVGLSHRGGLLKTPDHHLANFLSSHGFYTVKAGISHVGAEDQEHGYLNVLEGENGSGETITERACSFLKEYKADKPFFLDVGFNETHRRGLGFNPEDASPGDGDGNPDDLKAAPAYSGVDPDVQRDWKDYANAVERLDNYYESILDHLEQAGCAKDTLVIATTDHGVAFPEMKCSLTSRGTGVLLLMRYPNGIAEGIRSKALVSHLDVFPTICDLLNVPKPHWLQGSSLIPLIQKEKNEIHEEIYSEVTFHAAFEPKRSVRTKKWNYIRNFATPHKRIRPNCDDGLTKQFWLKEGLFDQEVSAEELYDLESDPTELLNVTDDPSYLETKRYLRSKLAEWMERTDDPLLTSDPSVLPGPMTVNTWDQLHPAAGGMESEFDTKLWGLIQPL